MFSIKTDFDCFQAAQRRASQIQATQPENASNAPTIADAIELENLRQRDENIQKEQERKNGCFGYFHRSKSEIFGIILIFVD